MNKIILLVVAMFVSFNLAAQSSYDFCKSVDLSTLDNVERADCADTLKTTYQNKTNYLLKKINVSKSLDDKDKNTIQEAQKSFSLYKNKQCSMFLNNGASADGVINQTFCEATLIDQRNEILEMMTH